MLAVRRETLSIYGEVRALAWIGVMLIATGVGILVKKNFDHIGPLTIALVIAAAAAACYVWAALKRKAALDEYVVLLGALLISADVGFIEHQWHLLGDVWQRHFLILAIAHGIAAYFFESRSVLSLAIASFAAWFGIERVPNGTIEWAIRAFACAAIVGMFRVANRRKDFGAVFEHFAANLLFWGAITLAFDRDWKWAGAAIGLTLGVAAVIYGIRRGRGLFVIYGYVYGLIAVDAAVVDILPHGAVELMVVVVSTVAVIVAMIVTYFHFRHVADA